MGKKEKSQIKEQQDVFTVNFSKLLDLKLKATENRKGFRANLRK